MVNVRAFEKLLLKSRYVENLEYCADWVCISRTVHAEQNAIINADPADMEGATIYIVGINADGTLASGKPCLLCRRMLRNAKLAQVVYYETDGSIVTCRPDEIHDWADTEANKLVLSAYFHWHSVYTALK